MDLINVLQLLGSYQTIELVEGAVEQYIQLGMSFKEMVEATGNEEALTWYRNIRHKKLSVEELLQDDILDYQTLTVTYTDMENKQVFFRL